MIHVADTVPYPWPFDGRLDPASFALVVLGDQPGITDDTVGTDTARASVELLAATTRDVSATMIHVRYGRAAGALAIAPEADDVVIDAIGWDALYGTPLEVVLRTRGITTIALAGFGSEVTVDSTVRTLNDRGWECLVVTDACAPFDAELGRRAHASLTMSGGIFGALGTTAALVAALTRSTEATP